MKTKKLLAFLFSLQCIFWLILIRYFIQNLSQPREKFIFSAALAIKVLAGCGVGWLYMFYYEGGDTVAYFHDALLLSDFFFTENPHTYLKVLTGSLDVENLQYNAQERALFFSKIASLIGIFSLQNYWLIAICLSLFNGIASWWFVIKLKDFFKKDAFLFLIPFLFYPSVVFWSSGLLKETVALAMIYLLCGIFLQVITQKISGTKWFIYLTVSLLSAWLLWMLKYYYAAILLPCLLMMLVYHILQTRTSLLFNLWQSLLMIGVTLTILFIIIMQWHPNLHHDMILKAIIRNHDLSVAASNTGAYVEYEHLRPTLSSIFYYFPKAVFSGLFRPLPAEGNSVFHFLSGMENLMVLGLNIFTIYLILTKKVKIHLSPLLVVCVFYVVMVAGIVALASPNFGSLVRYKVAYAPFWLCLCLLAIHASRRFRSTSQSMKKR